MLRHCQRQFSVASRTMANYGFIGLGQMGQHMARHIYEKLEPHDHLYVYDTVPQHTESFLATVAGTSPGTVTALDSIGGFVHAVDAPLDYVVTSVPEGKHVKAVIEELVQNYQSTGTGAGATTFLDTSTIDIPTSIEIHHYVKQHLPTFDFIDTPVSGGTAGARKGTLSFMLSRANESEISPPLLQLLTKMGTNIFPCGPRHGAGLAAKLSNNYLLAVTNLAVADSFQLANSFGLDMKKFAKLVAVSTGKSWASVDNCPVKHAYPPEQQLPADVDYAGGFITKLTRKDLVLATKSAEANKRFLFLGEAGKHWYDKACEREDIANRDLGVLYEWLGELEQNERGDLVEIKAKA